MALIVEDGTGNPLADSYVSIVEADAYHLARGNDAWATLDDTVKEQLIRKAMDYVNTMFDTSWSGYRAVTAQGLSWPRTYVLAYDTTYYDSDVVPKLLKEAIFELALIARTTPLMPTVTRGKKRVKVGPLEVEYDGNSATANRFVAATSRLSALLGGFNRQNPMVRLIRV